MYVYSVLIAQNSQFILQAPRCGLTKQQRESFACFFRYAKEELAQQKGKKAAETEKESDITTSKSGMSPGKVKAVAKDSEHRIPDEASRMTEEEADEEEEDNEDDEEETEDKEA